MREIKFRAWDKQRGTISYGEREDFDDMVGFRFEHTENIDGDLSKERVIEQYTGLKDVNGVEIYENDIVDTHWGNEENRLVKYDNEMGFYLTPDQDQPYWTTAYRGKYEVVGNIHEQPELLEDKL